MILKQQKIGEKIERMRSTVSAQRQDSLYVDVQRHQLVANEEHKSMPSKRNTCCFVRKRLRNKTMVISRDLEPKKIGTEVLIKNNGEMELHSGDHDARIR